MPDPLTDPAPPPIDLPEGKTDVPDDDTLAFVVDDAGNVLDLIYSGTEGIYVRDGGQWALTDPDSADPAIDSNEWLDTDPVGAGYYDQISANEDQPTMSDFVSVTPN